MMRKTEWLFTVILILVSILGVLKLRFETDILEVLPQDYLSVQALKDYQEHFAEERQVVVLVSNNEAEVSDDLIEELFFGIQEEFGDTLSINYKSSFEDNPESISQTLALLWSYASPALVKEFMDKFVSESTMRDHLVAAQNGLENSFDYQEAMMSVYDPMGLRTHPALEDLMNHEMSFQSDDGRYRLILIKKKEDRAFGYEEDQQWIDRIRDSLELRVKDLDLNGVDYMLTGGPVYNAEIGSGMEKDMSGTITITSLIVGVLFIITQRSVKQLVLVTALTGLVFAITLGISGWIYGTLNIVSVAFAAILLGLVVDYAVVILRESQHFGEEKDARTTRKKLSAGVIWAALSTSIVFGALMFSTFNGVRQLGGMIVIGLITGAFIMILFVPIYAQRFSQYCSAEKKGNATLKCSKKVIGAIVITWIVTISLIIGIKGIPKFQANLTMLEPEESEAAEAFAIIQKEFSAWSEEREVIVTKASDLPILYDQAIKVKEVLETHTDRLSMIQWGYQLIPNVDYYRENIKELSKLKQLRKQFIEVADNTGYTEQGMALTLQVLDQWEAMANHENGWLIEKCASDPIIGRFFSRDEQGDCFFTGQIEQKTGSVDTLSFYAEVEKKGGVVTGWKSLKAQLVPAVKRDFYIVLLPLTGCLLIVLYIVFRNIRETLLAVLTLVLSLISLNALAGLAGIQWNFLSGVAIPLVVGAGLDYAIHLIFALRRWDGDWGVVWHSVGKAICFCGASSAIGFGALTFSSTQVLRDMGVLCSLGIVVTVILSLLIIPTYWKRG